jgi:polygalacturonase
MGHRAGRYALALRVNVDQYDYPLVSAQNSSNIAIFGDGTINGGANDPPGHLVQSYNATLNIFVPAELALPGCVPTSCRVKLVVLLRCQDVVLDKITLLNSPLWTLELALSKNIRIERATIEGDRRWPNNDGCDVVSSKNVTIVGTTIATGDDSISLTTHLPVSLT